MMETRKSPDQSTSEMEASSVQPGSTEPPGRVTSDHFQAIFDAELDDLERRTDRTDHASSELVGLAISGGGIRSATFALGALQYLAKVGVLSRVDYLSTVSGGGYIGSALTWLLFKGQGDVSRKGFPFGTSRSDAEGIKGSFVQHLRRHGSYLTPGGGITFPSFLSVIIRGAIVSMAVYVALLLGLVLFFFPIFHEIGPNAGGWLADVVSAVVFVHAKLHLPSTTNAATLAAVAGFSIFLAISGLYAILTRQSRGSSGTSSRWYGWRRRYEHWMGILLCVVAVFAMLGTTPWVRAQLGGWTAEISSTITLTGIASALFAFYKSGRESQGQRIPLGLVVFVASALISYGLLLGLVTVAFFLHGKCPDCLPWTGLLLVLASAIIGWLVSLNYISVHRYYRDRLMEAYLPDPGAVAHETAQPSLEADDTRLDQVRRGSSAGATGPYHLINTNVVLVDSTNTTYSGRGGDNFILSPLYCGSDATDWCRTDCFADGRMTLATAMAISGAALNPNAGVAGRGPTRNRLFSFLLSLLNIRLGYWAPNPRTGSTGTPSLLNPGLFALFGMRMDEKRDYVQLSDGGHFENLGIYELLRRKARVIIVIDGAADGKYAFDDFANLLERARMDFGTKITIDLEPIVPKQPLSYPSTVLGATKGYSIGTIDYGSGSPGHLIYLKSSIVAGLPNDIYAYKLDHDEFPHQTTADQFFDERQFEAYRELGYRLGEKCLSDPAVRDLVPGKPAS